MKIKKFRAVDSQQAMRQIRAEIGPDASILTCYQVPEGIEFVVAVDAPSLQQLPVAAAPATAPVRQNFDSVKVLGRGELTQKLTVRANAFSETARAAIEKLGGTAEVVS